MLGANLRRRWWERPTYSKPTRYYNAGTKKHAEVLEYLRIVGSVDWFSNGWRHDWRRRPFCLVVAGVHCLRAGKKIMVQGFGWTFDECDIVFRFVCF